MSNLVRGSFAILCLILISSFSNCSKVDFASSKQAALQKSAFGDDVTQDQTRDDNDDDNTRNPEDYPNDDDLTVDVQRECSDRDTEDNGNVQLSSRVHLRVLENRKIVCTDTTKNYRSDLLNLESVKLQVNCALKDGNYELQFFDPDFKSSNSQRASYHREEGLGDVRIEVVNGKASLREKKLQITYASNPQDNSIGDVTKENYTKCEKFSSPLVVKFSEQPIKLSSPLDGILFDILGERAGHVKKQISWPVDDSIAFIALPNMNGEVKGINELFGDNTKGPDGTFSAHGYEALAKHDSNQDGFITDKDPIYFKLRLFTDKNRDGLSQQGELARLADRGLRSIDLSFDAGYAEKDKYGNKILFKSVAESDNGLLLIFDIWFRHID